MLKPDDLMAIELSLNFQLHVEHLDEHLSTKKYGPQGRDAAIDAPAGPVATWHVTITPVLTCPHCYTSSNNGPFFKGHGETLNEALSEAFGGLHACIHPGFESQAVAE